MMSVMMRMIKSMKAITNLMMIIDQDDDDDDDEGRKSSIPSVCLQKRVRPISGAWTTDLSTSRRLIRAK